ncbi:hypothetical protein TcBrA4_0080210 [Trypanosoma cruzi]|nr:hypothetical protein TcBrA4_0080210 [Trypanosoma cruzi]
MWISYGMKRRLTAQPSLLFWRVCSSFFRCPFCARARRDWAAPSHERSCTRTHSHATVAQKWGANRNSAVFFALAQLLVYLLLTDNILSGVSLRLDFVGLLSNAIGQDRLTTFFCSYQS